MIDDEIDSIKLQLFNIKESISGIKERLDKIEGIDRRPITHISLHDNFITFRSDGSTIKEVSIGDYSINTEFDKMVMSEEKDIMIYPLKNMSYELAFIMDKLLKMGYKIKVFNITNIILSKK